MTVFANLVPTGAEIAAFSDSVHAANVEAGWWSDPATGNRKQRNVGEMLMLVVSELAEGAEGASHDLMDDKLPHRRMVEVELADTAIRIADMGGGLGLDLGNAFDELRDLILEPTRNQDFPGKVWLTVRLMRIVREVAEAMEGHRKGSVDRQLPNRSRLEVRLAAALLRIFRLSVVAGFDLQGAIAEKRSFNAQRPDHKLEARQAAGGKAY